MTMEQDYHGDKPWSFGGFQRIKENNPNFTKEDINRFLASNEICIPPELFDPNQTRGYYTTSKVIWSLGSVCCI